MSSARSPAGSRPPIRRSAVVVAAAFVLTLRPAAATEWDPAIEERWADKPPSLGIENAYRDTMVRWAEGSEVAARRYAAFQAEVVEGISGGRVTPRNYRFEDVERGLECLRLTEGNTSRILAELSPQALAAAYVFQLEVHVEQMLHPGRAWLYELEWQRLDRLKRAFRGRQGAPEKGQDRSLSGLLIETAARLEEFDLVDKMELARRTYEEALEHDPGSLAALYRAALLAEKLGLLRRAEQHLASFDERRPGDFEVRLRRALVRGRLAESEAMAVELADLTGSGAGEWIRELAWQELARYRGDREAADAVGTLEEALDALPGRRGLELQLAFYLGPTSVRGGRLLAKQLDGSGGVSQPSPRALYEKGRLEELARARNRVSRELAEPRRRLVEAVSLLERQEWAALVRDPPADLDKRDRRVFSECRGFRRPDATH